MEDDKEMDVEIIITDEDFVRFERVLKEYTDCDWEQGTTDFYFEKEDAEKIWEDFKPLRDFISDLGKAIGRK